MSPPAMPNVTAFRGAVGAPDTTALRGVAASPSAPLLELQGITKRWRSLPAPVLDDVDLALEPGTSTWIGGRNGIGKTTLLRIAAGLIGCERGSVSAGGLNPVADRHAFQRRVAFLSAGNTGLYARLSVHFHLDYWAKLAFIPRSERARAVQRALIRFELEDLAKRRVDRMSMGQRQRVRLAGVFLYDPDVVLLDEPRNSLDSEGIAMLAAALQALMLGGGAVLWCSPTGEEARMPCDRRLVLEKGRLSEE